MSKSLGKNTDVPGNALASQAAYVRQLVNWAETVLTAERVFDKLFDEGVYVRGMSIRLPNDESPEYLMVVRLDGEGGKRVGFHSADTLLSLVVGTLRRLRSGSIKFKEDEYD